LSNSYDSLFKETVAAIELAVDANDFARAKELHRQAHALAQSDSHRVELAKMARWLQITEALAGISESVRTQPIFKVPAMTRYNGVGNALHAFEKIGPVPELAVATLYLDVLWIPVVPRARYLVRTLEAGHYEFLGKLPLTKDQRQWNLLLLKLAVVSTLAIGLLYVLTQVA
jgi:hypothetical protein